MKKYKLLDEGHIILLIFSTLILSKSFVEGFNVGIRATSCTLDPSENNNSCKSLYDAVCDGAHCKCPSGTHEDKSLKKCVPGAGAASKPKGDDEFGDLPFDYVPGKKPETKPKPKPTQSPPPPVRPNVPAQPQAPVEGGYKPKPYNPNPGYPVQPGGYPPQPGYNPNQPGYPSQPGYNPNQPGYNPIQPQPGYPGQPGYNPNQPGYNPKQPQPGYPNQPGYNPNQPGGYPPQPGYNPNQPGYNPNQPYYIPNQPGQPGYNPNYPSGYNPNQPGGYSPGSKGGSKGTYKGDPHLAEKTGGGIGGGVGLLILVGLIYFCCCRGEKGQNMRSKLPFFKGGGQPGANYQMQQPGQYPNAPPPAGG